MRWIALIFRTWTAGRRNADLISEAVRKARIEAKVYCTRSTEIAKRNSRANTSTFRCLIFDTTLAKPERLVRPSLLQPGCRGLRCRGRPP